MTKFLGSYPDLGNGGARILHPDVQGVDVTLANDLIALGGASIGNTDNPLAGQLKVGVAAGSGYLTFYPGSYVPGHIDGSELLFDISGAEALKLLSSGHLRLRNNKLFKALNAAGNADLDLIGTNSSDAILLGSGLTGVLKAASSVVSAATIVNADVSASAGITPDKLSGPLFSYVRSATVNNVTGNGTAYTCPFDSAVVSNANYNSSTGIFTAPVAGKYLLVAHVGCVPSASGVTQGAVQIVTTGQSWRFDFNPWAIRHSASGVASVAHHAIASLAASDTAKITLALTGAGSDNCGFAGNNGFSGFSAWRVG